MPVQCSCDIKNPDGGNIASTSRMKYLGAQIASDGHINIELSQKLGLAARDFKILKSIWSHAYMSCKFKYQVYSACILQKLLYGLDGAVLNKAEQKRLDAFHSRCLRSILRISPAHISRVSNAYVLKKMEVPALSQILLERQLILFGIIYRMDNQHPIRQSVFETNSVKLRSLGDRRVGRPRSAWAPKLLQIALKIAGNTSTLESL